MEQLVCTISGCCELHGRFFFAHFCTHNNTEGFLAHDIFDAGNKEVLHEIPWITTNFTSQWCLNIITALRYIREDLPKTMEELEKLLAGLDESGFHKA